MTTIHELLFLLFLFFPAGMANAAPIVAAKIPFLKKWTTPLDHGTTFMGKRLFGENKTYRGLFAGLLASAIGVFMQINLYNSFSFLRDTSLLDYSKVSSLLLILALGIGPLLGDAVESFIKRQVGIQPGVSWIPFDQIDYIIGTIVCTIPLFHVTLFQYLLLFGVGVIAHITANIIGYLLKLKSVPY